MEFNEIMERLGVGTLSEEPKEVKGGFLHKVYRVTTAKGIFAVKVLNTEIMKRPCALGNTINSEKIAAIFGGFIPVVAALCIQGRQIHEIDKKYYMIFQWVEGKSVFPPDINEQHCEAIGDILGKMHRQNIAVQDVKAEEETMELFEWRKYLQTAKEQEDESKIWVSQYENAIKDIETWNWAACDVQDILTKNMVISHRDLDPKNVLWKDDEPCVIDWEAAGYVNPYQELLEVISYWADDGKGSL